MKKLSLIILSVIFFSCGGNGTSTETENTDEKVNTTEVEESTSTSSKTAWRITVKNPKIYLLRLLLRKM